MATRAAYSDMFRTSMSDGLAAGTCFAWLCEIVIVESSWLTTTEYSLASQGSSRVCETVRLSVGGKPGAISSRKGQKLSTNQNQHELSAAANRWIFVTPARMFLPLLSLSRILPAVMLSSGISNLLTYNTLYLGTGDPFNYAPGGFMVKSSDGGQTWSEPIILSSATRVLEV